MKDAPALYIHKTDVGGKELPGAVLSVLDSDGNRIQQWTSTSQPKQLPVTGPDDTLSGGIMLSDETTERVYTLHEDAAPAGYQLAQDIQFKVLRTTENKLTVYYRANPNEPSDDSWLWGEYVYEMPDQFDRAVTEIMARKGVTQEALALELGIDRRMVYKILHSDSPSMEQCVAICVALKLPYFVSEKIIENAGLRFKRTDKHHLYRQMLVQSHHLTVERCNDILTRKKMLPFFPNSETNIGVS